MKLLERIKLVREAFDLDTCMAICTAKQEFFAEYGTEFKKNGGKDGFAFYYKDNGSDILAIAHMDSVQDKPNFDYAKWQFSGREILMSPWLDDRLGVYTICEWLPKLGIKFDILLTTDEEKGKSTGELFVPDPERKYKWMFQFDRMGNDVVMYQYRNDAALKKLEECGFKTGYGSASDISKMDDLGCLGFNFGIGYENAHSKDAWADLQVATEQVAKFLKFFQKHHREHMVYDKTKKTTTITTYGGYSSYGSNQYKSWNDDHESDFGRRVGGIWYDKLIYDEKTRLYVLNQALYKRYPGTMPPSDRVILQRNSTWNQIAQTPMLDGPWTEAQVLAIAKGDLIIVGEESPKDPLSEPDEPSGGSFTVDHTWDIDEECECHHSRFVHRRLVNRGNVLYADACDFYRCPCTGFRKPESEQRADIVLGGY